MSHHTVQLTSLRLEADGIDEDMLHRDDTMEVDNEEGEEVQINTEEGMGHMIQAVYQSVSHVLRVRSDSNPCSRSHRYRSQQGVSI